ncbi:hypothetical protein AB0323_20465 [Arthrobacter sp. NPDC080031]|uniref:hypothetical protein n=1 Tax=Arthrobacter sp. NPDC080031 TaxID=3155918 RepID=UPI00344F2771
MLALWENTPRSLREISDELDLEPTTISPLFRRLESSGLLHAAGSGKRMIPRC